MLRPLPFKVCALPHAGRPRPVPASIYLQMVVQPFETGATRRQTETDRVALLPEDDRWENRRILVECADLFGTYEHVCPKQLWRV